MRIASVDPGRRSGRLSLTSAEDPSAGSGPSIHAVWTVEEGVEAARILVEAAATDDDAGR